MRELNVEQVLEALEEVVQEKGEEFVYEGPCTYTGAVHAGVPDTEPMCIVGHVIAKLDPLAFRRIVISEVRNGAEANVNSLSGSMLTRDPQVRTLLGAAQGFQDDYIPWGLALEGAKRMLAGEKHLIVLNDLHRKRMNLR